ncbi:hypothetical protein GBA65_14735 [Rubrobacter marinus]|uniref:Uncharacterized protein n=1 Tax=Rubrobacter marinus TaxID=2653852 RepID=A0A6G8PZM3_9ACTN|nr:hypothetical protein [Rubrobacter marinus]QIN79567.1 hypothetical protein GBA65_14735 [Rubrobacter marinus]
MHGSEATSHKVALGLAVAAAALYALVLLAIVCIERFPGLVPDDAPGLAMLVFFLVPFASSVVGVLASVLGLRCILLQRGRIIYAALAILVGAPVTVLAPLQTPVI